MGTETSASSRKVRKPLLQLLLMSNKVGKQNVGCPVIAGVSYWKAVSGTLQAPRTSQSWAWGGQLALRASLSSAGPAPSPDRTETEELRRLGCSWASSRTTSKLSVPSVPPQQRRMCREGRQTPESLAAQQPRAPAERAGGDRATRLSVPTLQCPGLRLRGC